MDSMSDFISQKDEITRLNKQIDMIAGFYNKQISTLTVELKNTKSNLSYYKCKALKVKSDRAKQTKENRTVKAIAMIKVKLSGVDISVSDICSSCYLSINYVYKLHGKVAKGII
jgi:hypothetical protein